MSYDVVVVGAGAAGILAAWRSGSMGAKTMLLEKNPRIGTKILISGGGKCNITHAGDVEDVLRGFRQNEARFLRPACYRFTNDDVVSMLTARGLEVTTRPDGRIFPVDRTAKDVVAILGSFLPDAGVDVRLSSPVKLLVRREDGIAGVETGSETFDCRHVILAVGGSSYPGTGTTGDGYGWARDFGHTIVKLRAALAPLYMDGMADRAGVALRDVVLKAKQGREIARWRGDLLFTHRGVSGPTALGVSRVVAERIADGPVTLDVDLAPEVPSERMRERLDAWIETNPRRSLSAFTEELVPHSLREGVLHAAKIDPATARALSAKDRNRLVEALKAWPLGEVRAVPLEKGEVVAGGVSLEEVDPHSMRSLKCPGLTLCGEVLDVSGAVGGYNLQAAFSTGVLAGETAASDALGLQTQRV